MSDKRISEEELERLIKLNQSHFGNKKSKWLYLLMIYERICKWLK